MIYPSREARDAALGLSRDRVPDSAASHGRVHDPGVTQPLVTADGQQVVVRVECTHPPLDTATIAWGIVRGWFYIMVITLAIGLVLGLLGVGFSLAGVSFDSP